MNFNLSLPSHGEEMSQSPLLVTQD